MSKTSPNSSRLSGLTVTCHQCGGSSMTRLDRKEYRCTHCGAITVVSDDDADRLEEMLHEALNRPATSEAAPGSPSNSLITPQWGIGFLGVLIILGWTIALATHHDSQRRDTAISRTRDERTVPTTQVVLSSLQWVPENVSLGNYVGMLYNHSGYTIDVPRYSVTLFRNGMKDGSTLWNSPLHTLQPGEYERVNFRVLDGTPNDRYEVEPPDSIDRSTGELAPVTLLNPQLVHQQGGDRYILVGTVQNTFRLPISGVGQLILYGKDQQIVGSAEGYFAEIRPGEKTIMSFDAWTQTDDTPITAYEYLIDARF
jgi:hypothetical protein